MKHHHESACCTTKKWYNENLVRVFALTIVLLFSSYLFFPAFYIVFMDYLGIIWWAILLGLLLGGIIDYFVPEDYVTKYLAKNEKKTIFAATIMGFLMSVCSHGILALAIQLYKKGASVPAVISFLLAAPWANITITIMLFGFFGIKAIYFIIVAVLIAIVTGLIYQVLDQKNLIEKNKVKSNAKDFSIWKDIKKRLKKAKFNSKELSKATKGVLKGSWNLSKMILWWILIGILLASAAGAFIPEHLFKQYLGPTILGLAITLVFAIIIEVCSEGSSPVAFEIFRQTGALGNSFVFLMAGVATDYTEIGLIWTNIGKKAAIWLPVITVPQIILFGYLFNVLL